MKSLIEENMFIQRIMVKREGTSEIVSSLNLQILFRSAYTHVFQGRRTDYQGDQQCHQLTSRKSC